MTPLSSGFQELQSVLGWSCYFRAERRLHRGWSYKGEGCSPHCRQEVIREVGKAMRTSKASFQGLLSLTKTCLLKFLLFLQVVPPAGDQVLNTPAWWGALMFKQKLAPKTGLSVFVSCTLIWGGGWTQPVYSRQALHCWTTAPSVFFNNTGNSYCL